MENLEPIKTARSLVEAFGGVSDFSERMGYGIGRVRTWLWRGSFPAHAKPKILIAAQEDGLEVSPRLVGLEPAE